MYPSACGYFNIISVTLYKIAVSLKGVLLKSYVLQNNILYFHPNAITSRVKAMVLNAAFSNISVISWWSVSLVEETGVSRENHPLAASN